MNKKRKAAAFRKKYKLKIINSSNLSDILISQGYTIIEFNGVMDSEEVNELVSALDIRDQIAHSKCFTYQDDKYRLVFIHEDLNKEERTIALAHEEGHIWCGHMTRQNVFGQDVVQEHEANEFCHYLLKDREGKERKRIIIAVITIAILLCAFCSGRYYKQEHEKMIYTDDLYRTEGGTKYHLKECIYIRERKDVFRLKKKEYFIWKTKRCF